MSAEEVPHPILTAASCDWPLGCDVDVRADYLAHSWPEAATAHARDLKAAGWAITAEGYFCPDHAKELR